MANKEIQLSDGTNNLYPVTRPLIDITSKFTISDTDKCRNFKAKTDGHKVYVQGYAMSGVGDQTSLVTIPVGYRPNTTYIPGSVICLNGVDLNKNIQIATAGNVIQMRLSGTISGSSGVVFYLCWDVTF